MMHENSIKQASDYASAFNLVTLRSVSVVVAWLHMYLRSEKSNWETRVISENRSGFNDTVIKKKSLEQFELNLSSNVKKFINHAAFYEEAVKPAPGASLEVSGPIAENVLRDKPRSPPTKRGPRLCRGRRLLGGVFFGTQSHGV